MYQKKLYLCPVMLWHSNMQGLSFAERFHRLEEDAQQDEGNAEVEREINLPAFAEDEEGEDNRVAGLKVIRQIDSKGREAFQGLDLEQIHGNGAE